MKLHEIKAIADELDWVEPSHGLARIAIIEELAERLKCPRDDTYITDIITRHLEPLK